MFTAIARRMAVGLGACDDMNRARFMSSQALRPPRAVDWAVVAVGLAVVGFIDWITGVDVRVLSLYFVPLAWAGWRLRRPGASLGAAAAAGVWVLAQYTGGVRYANEAIWFINLFTQGAAFATVGWLMAALADRFEAEQALSRTDALTNLQNRRGLAEKARLVLALSQRHARAVSLACIDLDHFKQANDTFGHAAGDQVLIACATVFKSSLRATDLAARVGGDEFLVLLPETGRDSAVTLMERIRQAIEAQPSIRAAGVTATIGVITNEPASLTLDQLMGQADTCMYEGKRGGRNRVFGNTAH
jgi:diguanylate cyclase (GGDEF)-like protein